MTALTTLLPCIIIIIISAAAAGGGATATTCLSPPLLALVLLLFICLAVILQNLPEELSSCGGTSSNEFMLTEIFPFQTFAPASARTVANILTDTNMLFPSLLVDGSATAAVGGLGLGLGLLNKHVNRLPGGGERDLVSSLFPNGSVPPICCSTQVKGLFLKM
jgi:hypothetical protein